MGYQLEEELLENGIKDDKVSSNQEESTVSINAASTTLVNPSGRVLDNNYY